MPASTPDHNLCPDCAVLPGENHVPGCDVERCPACRGQALSCGCGWDGHTPPPLPWTGTWPGEREAADLGWFCVMTDEGWCQVPPGYPGARPDLNRYSVYVQTGRDPGAHVHTREGSSPTVRTTTEIMQMQQAGTYRPGGISMEENARRAVERMRRMGLTPK